jgi:hypothetical protein
MSGAGGLEFAWVEGSSERSSRAGSGCAAPEVRGARRHRFTEFEVPKARSSGFGAETLWGRGARGSLERLFGALGG